MKKLPSVGSDEWEWSLGTESMLWCAKGVTKEGWHLYVSREHTVDVSHYGKMADEEYPDTDAFIIVKEGPTDDVVAKRFAERLAHKLWSMLDYKRGK
jgi:hypothetical protein